MLSDMAGQIYIYESSVSDAALMQAASVFNELDELSFVVGISNVTRSMRVKEDCSDE